MSFDKKCYNKHVHQIIIIFKRLMASSFIYKSKTLNECHSFKEKKERMSSSLLEVATQVTRLIFPIIIILGILANSLNIIILRRANLKRYSCTLYLLILSINNVFYTCTDITFNFLIDSVGINLMQYSDFSCKFITFLLDFCPQASLYMLVLASIDRYCCSSLSVQRRRLSSIRTAQWSIPIALIWAVLLTIGTAIMVSLQNTDGSNECITYPEILFNQILRSLQIIVYVFIAPFLMIFFGLLTIHNINQSKRNHIVVFRNRRSERQLTRMLIVQVSTHILLSLPFCVVFFMAILPIEFDSTIMYSFLFTIFKIPFYIDFITPFFLYILSAQLYRTELILLFKKIFRIHRDVAIHPIRN